MENEYFALFTSLLMGILIGILITATHLFFSQDLVINQEIGNDICKKITGNETAIARDSWYFKNDGIARNGVEDGTLVCVLPSYDSTQNIIIRTNNNS